MRLKITLDNPRETVIPINYQHHLTALVYRLLAASDPDYARFLHDEGYAAEGEGKRCKLFVFSWLRPRNRQAFRAEGEWLRLAPGPLEWFLASPVSDFLTHSATGLLSAGSVVPVERATFPIQEVCALPAPQFTETMRFTCLSPIVVGLPTPERGTRYLRPSEGEAFSEAVRRNLLHKYRLIHGAPPADDRLCLTFDAGYLERHGGGTKKMTFKGIDIIGALAPFTLTGSVELVQVAWECGLGEKNSSGFGMVEVHLKGREANDF